MQPFSHPYHLCLIMDRHLLIQYFFSDGPLIRWHPFVVNRPGIIYLRFLQISQHALAHPIYWVGGIKLMELYISCTGCPEQPLRSSLVTILLGCLLTFLQMRGTVVQSLITTVFTVWISCHTTVCLKTTGQIYIPSPNQKAFVSQAVSQNPNMYKPH